MPHVIVKLYPGKTDLEKAKIAEQVTKAIMDSAGSSEASVSVGIEDVAPADWAETVYRPEIVGKADTLFKKPGYNPL
ncbi:tautomerase family protein [Humitalea sp. 24SJ18S-53]|uniref:tautomerase family protein n=1 Tax=Humitalea sp. 24SJ18S-53 TaxID=3422307 RepID=UPI003D670C7F